MTREWAPGDVALIEAPSGTRHRAVMGRDGWVCLGRNCEGSGCVVESARPLLVLDPESDADAHRLIRAFWDHSNDDCDDVQAMRDAMRSLVAPPEPEEPVTLGAVVTLNHPAYEWARAVRVSDSPHAPWYYTDSSGNGGLRAWHIIAQLGVTS